MHRDVNFNFGSYPARLLALKADVEQVDHEAHSSTHYSPATFDSDGRIVHHAQSNVYTTHDYHVFFQLAGGSKYQRTFNFNPKIIKGHDVVLYFVSRQDQPMDTGQACGYYNRSLDLSYCWAPEKFKGLPPEGSGARFTYCAFFALLFGVISYVMWGAVTRSINGLPASEYMWVGGMTLYTFYLFIRAMTHISRFRKRSRMMKDLRAAVMGMVGS